MMMWLAPARKIVRGLLLGDTDLPQQCNVAMPDPQDEISVWLHGEGAPRLFQAYVKRRRGDPDVRMNALETRSMTVCFICPRPVVLVSVVHGETGSIFPMNLFGPIGKGYLAFALNSSRQAAPLVERAARAVFSNIPSEHIEVAKQLGKNHRQKSVQWDQLPFETQPSVSLGIPVPCFALRVREMEVEAVRKPGSHTLFVARVIHDEHLQAGPQFTRIHGIYQARRLRMRQAGAGARDSVGSDKKGS